MNKLELLLHPVRLRVILLFRGRQLTTAQIAEALPDVSKATVYRHITLLVDGDVLEVTGEEQKRGTIERHYSLREGAARIDEDTFAAMTPEEHRGGFTALIASLLAEFNAYLDRQSEKPSSLPMAYGQRRLVLNEQEGAAFANDLQELMVKYAGVDPAPARQAFLAGLVFFPVSAPADGGRFAEE